MADGPFTEAKELIGGYRVIQAKSKEEAIAWAKRCPCPDGEMIEFRQVFEMPDFGAEVERGQAAAVGEIGKRCKPSTPGEPRAAWAPSDEHNPKFGRSNFS